jgi:WS/DGAT/MGAT family acyltransferase
VQRATLPPPGDQTALQDVVSLLASTPLDLTRPLWQFHLIENYAECCALVMRFHHSIGDGMALLHVILSLADSNPDAAWPVVQPEHLQRDRADRPGIWGQPADPDRKAVRSPVGTLLREGFGLLAEPERMAELGRFLLHKPDPDTVLKGELGVDKRAAWSAGIALEEVKAIQQALGGTVNDLLLTIVTGALRRYMEDRGDPVDGIAIRTAVPVNLRPAGSEGELGNRVGAVFVTLPISIADPACRLSEIVRRMNDQKDSLEAPAFYVALGALGQTPARIANTLISTFSTRATAVMTNVRGPQQRLYLAGAPVEALLPWAPTTGRMGVAVSILSYAGEVRLGLSPTKASCPTLRRSSTPSTPSSRPCWRGPGVRLPSAVGHKSLRSFSKHCPTARVLCATVCD